MKLNMDCVRAVMLCAEEYTDYNHYCYFISYQKNNVNDFLLDDPETPPAYQLELEKTYDNDDLFYAVEYCVKSGFVETLFSKDTYRIPISRITPDGHRFLENIFFCDGSNGIFSRAYHAAVNLNFDLHFVLLRVNPVQLPAFQIDSPAAALLNPRISVLL